LRPATKVKVTIILHRLISPTTESYFLRLQSLDRALHFLNGRDQLECELFGQIASKTWNDLRLEGSDQLPGEVTADVRKRY
jgi:hypothetical protein